MLLNRNLIVKKAIIALLLILPALGSVAQNLDKENKDLYREFVRLQNYGQEEEFYAIAKKYEQFLKSNGLYTQYFKIKTNKGFFLINHQHPLKAMQTAVELDKEILDHGDTTLLYLASGLKGDIYKTTHNVERADSTYKKALTQVGQTDPKFTMLVYMSLAEVNLTTEPNDALNWADMAHEKAKTLENIEHQSLALGTKGYLYFMLAEKDSFASVYRQYYELEDAFKRMDEREKTIGRQRFSHHYQNALEVARTAFDGKYDEALDMANTLQLNVDRQMVVFRIFGMEGLAEKESSYQRLKWGFIIMTGLYILVYFMGRRRLWLNIQKRKAELNVALEKAEMANKMKAAFIRSMSHEIRTPLNAVNGFSQILCSTDFELSDEEKLDMKQRIMSNAEAITLIINELLELSAGESVTLDDDNLSEVRPNEICQQAIKEAKRRNIKQLQLIFSSELDDEFSLKSNSEAILQILKKIIDNAYKFTNEGTISMHAYRKENTVEISITDTGVGIPEDRQDDVFDNFVKLDEYKEGVGLGLPICKRLAHSLGGDVLLDKNYKTGSRFILQLPVR